MGLGQIQISNPKFIYKKINSINKTKISISRPNASKKRDSSKIKSELSSSFCDNNNNSNNDDDIKKNTEKDEYYYLL